MKEKVGFLSLECLKCGSHLCCFKDPLVWIQKAVSDILSKVHLFLWVCDVLGLWGQKSSLGKCGQRGRCRPPETLSKGAHLWLVWGPLDLGNGVPPTLYFSSSFLVAENIITKRPGFAPGSLLFKKSCLSFSGPRPKHSREGTVQGTALDRQPTPRWLEWKEEQIPGRQTEQTYQMP